MPMPRSAASSARPSGRSTRSRAASLMTSSPPPISPASSSMSPSAAAPTGAFAVATGADTIPGTASRRIASPARPGFTLWSFEDVTARHEMERVIRDEQAKLADFLDNAPVGFYSVDRHRPVPFRQRGAGRLARRAGERAGRRRARVSPISWPSRCRTGVPPHAPFEAGRGETGGEVALKGRQGRIFNVLITQSVVRTGDVIRTHSVVRDLTPEREWKRRCAGRASGSGASSPMRRWASRSWTARGGCRRRTPRLAAYSASRPTRSLAGRWSASSTRARARK